MATMLRSLASPLAGPGTVPLLLLPLSVITATPGSLPQACLPKTCSWSCMIFTLEWPGGFCQHKADLCRLPPYVNGWTIHGLWPVHPKNCSTCWPMFHSDIQEVEAELEQYWPSLLKGTCSFQFWQDEWGKHGVQAGNVEGMNSPLRYFKTCLRLRERFDLDKRLEAAGITPSCERTYKLQEVRAVLDPLVGKQTEIQCVTDKQGKEVWFQVKIELFRNLTVGCNHYDNSGVAASGGHPCPVNSTFFFLPLDHKQPSRPCG